MNLSPHDSCQCRLGKLRLLLLIPVVALAAGPLTACSSFIAGSGPTSSAIASDSSEAIDGDQISGYTLIDVSANNIENYRVRKQVDRPNVVRFSRTQARVRLAPGDVIKVMIAESVIGGFFGPLSGGGTKFEKVLVSSSGKISLPYVGKLSVRGLSLSQVEARIHSRLLGKAIQPQVYVELVANRNNSVLVAGEVKQPLRISLLEGPMTIIDAIARAGGLNLPPLQTDAVVRRGRKVRRIAVSRVYNGLNHNLRAGDVLTLVNTPRRFNAVGAVKTAGQHDLKIRTQSLMDSLSQAGWLNDTQANPTGVYVFRQREKYAKLSADGKWHAGRAIFQFDMRDPKKVFLAQAFQIRPGDTIYVTNAPATEWLKLVQPLASTLIAVRSGATIATTTGSF